MITRRTRSNWSSRSKRPCQSRKWVAGPNSQRSVLSYESYSYFIPRTKSLSRIGLHVSPRLHDLPAGRRACRNDAGRRGKRGVSDPRGFEGLGVLGGEPHGSVSLTQTAGEWGCFETAGMVAHHSCSVYENKKGPPFGSQWALEGKSKRTNNAIMAGFRQAQSSNTRLVPDWLRGRRTVQIANNQHTPRLPSPVCLTLKASRFYALAREL